MKRKVRNKPVYLFFMVAFCLLINSCKTVKESTSSEVTMEAKGKNELLDQIRTHEIQYNTFSGNLKANIQLSKNEKGMSSGGMLRVIKNEKIQLSFQPFLGIEVFRMIITPDSIIILDRMNKYYVAESMDDIKREVSFDLNFYNLQSMFTNQLFLSGKPDLNKSDYKLFSIEQAQYNALIKSQDNQLSYSFLTDHSETIKSMNMSNKAQTTVLSWKYDRFNPIKNRQLFPMEMNINLIHPKDEVSVSFSFSKIELDKEIDINLNIPQKYKRITLSQAIEIVKKLT